MRLKRFGTGAVSIGFFLIFGALFLLGHQSKAAANNLFGNIAYLTSYPDFADKVTLVNGTYAWNNGRFFYNLYFEGHHVYGDFNRDGLKDAAVIISEGEGGSGDFRALAFLINDGHRLVHRASHYLGDRVIINSLKNRGSKVVVDMFVHQEHDCMAGPTLRVQNVYDYLKPDPDNLLSR